MIKRINGTKHYFDFTKIVLTNKAGKPLKMQNGIGWKIKNDLGQFVYPSLSYKVTNYGKHGESSIETIFKHTEVDS